VTRFEATECFEKVFNLSFYVKSHNAIVSSIQLKNVYK
jgi:hypothetical protein